MKTLKNIIKRCEVCQKNNQNLDYNEVGSILERTGKLILLICQKLMAILVYKFGWILLLDGLRLFPVVMNRLRRL